MNLSGSIQPWMPDIQGSVLDNLIVPLIILLFTVVAGHIVRAVVRRSYEEVVRRHKGAITFDQTHYAIVSRLVVFFVYVIGVFLIIYQIAALRTVFYSALAGAGVLALILGFATKDVFANLMSGISLAIYEPFRVGDKVTVKDQTGTVEDLTLRHTVIRTWENKRIIVPNAIMSGEAIINYSIGDPKIQKYVDVSISYESDVDTARAIMLDEAKRHPGSLRWRQDIPGGGKEEKGPMVLVAGLGDSGIVMRLYFWAPDFGAAFVTGCELTERIKERFQAEGIEIPYPHRVIIHRKTAGVSRRKKARR